MPGVAPRNDLERFEQLYLRHRAAVYGFLEGLVGDSEVAEEHTQAAFVALFHRMAALRRDFQPAVALYRLAYQVARQHERRPVWDLLKSSTRTPGEIDDPAAALRTLPLPERAALLLRDREGLSYEEIAEILDCSLGAVRAWIAQARARLMVGPLEARCTRATSLWSAEFDDRLEPEERAWLEDHCRACRSCAQVGAAYRTLRERLRHIVQGSFGMASEAELFATVRAGQRTGGRRIERVFGWGALVSVLLVGWSVLLLVARASAVPDEPPAAAAPKPSPVPVVASGTMYVLNQTSPGGITIVDGPSHSVLKQIGLSFRPTALARDAANGRLYVAQGAPVITVLDPDANAIVAEVPLRYPAWSAVLSPDGRSLFATHFTSLRATQVDIARGETVREYHVGARPSSLAVDPSGRWLFVGAMSGKLARFDLRTGRETGSYSFDVAGDESFRRVVVAPAPDGRTVYAAMLEDGQVMAVDLATGRVRRAKVRPAGAARAAAVSPDGTRLVISSTAERAGGPGVLVLRTDRLVEVSGSAERTGVGLAFSGDGKVLYLTQPSLGLLYAYDAETGQLLGATDVGSAPGAVVFAE